MTNDAPLFTVAIPTIGRWSSLRACLASLRSGWPDRARGPLVVLSGTHLRLPAGLDVATTTARAGSVGAARNAAFRHSSTDWTVFLDDDCLAPPDWLAQIEGRLARWAADRVGVAGGAVVDADRDGRLYAFARELNYMRTASTMKRRVDGIPSLGAANLVVARACWHSVGGFDETLVSTEDYDLLVRAHRAGWGIATYLDAPPVVHAHTTSLAGFVRRQHRYGRGVAQTVRRNSLDARAHRIYAERGALDLGRAALRFASEDLRWLRHHGRAAGIGERLIATVRALAWQAGARRES